MHNVTTSHLERKQTKFVSNKTAIYRRNRSSVCLLFAKLALLCAFLFNGLSHTQEQAGNMPWMQAVAPSPSYNRDASSRMPGNHIHGNGLPATFVPGRRNVCEGYWAVDESYKKSLASPFHYFLNVKSTSQILRVYLTGKEKPVREAQH